MSEFDDISISGSSSSVLEQKAQEYSILFFYCEFLNKKDAKLFDAEKIGSHQLGLPEVSIHGRIYFLDRFAPSTV